MMNAAFEWVGTICGISGAALIAANIRLSPWGWWLFLVSSLSLCLYGVAAGAWGIFLLNLCFVATNVTGLIRVWLPYYRAKRARAAVDRLAQGQTPIDSLAGQGAAP